MFVRVPAVEDAVLYLEAGLLWYSKTTEDRPVLLRREHRHPGMWISWFDDCVYWVNVDD